MTKWTRRGVLKSGTALTLGAALPMPFISKTLGASGKITVGMEAGSVADRHGALEDRDVARDAAVDLGEPATVA